MNLLVTESAACIELTDAALSDDHERYESLYSLIQNNIVHYNVVLTNGKEISVNETSHSDLLYALKETDHNFVIIISVMKKIYPREN